MADSVAHALGWFPGGEAISRVRDASLAAAAAAGYGGEDRISALGDHLLRGIVSRLPVKDAARTAALASRWRHLWRSTPLVMYDAHLLPACDPAAVARVLADHPGPFHTVSIAHCDFASREQRELAGWPRLLAAKGVEDLVLVNQPADYGRLPDFPADILRCASLRRLFLGFWRFPDTGAGPPRGPADGFPHLRELSVFGTDMAGRDLDRLLASSPVLDTLALVLSRSCERVHLRSQSLKRVLLWHCFVEEVVVVDSPLLERLTLWRTSVGEDGTVAVRVKIASAPKLRVLGYLEPRVHHLQIAQNVIKPDTNASRSTVVPSVKTLALKVNFGVLEEVKMLASILRCFPNVDMLHVESVVSDDKATGRLQAKFWREIHPIKCMTSHIQKMVIHEFRGEQSEIEFLKFVGRSAEKLRALVVVITKEMFALAYKLNEVITKVAALSRGVWACHSCVMVVGPRVENCWSFRRASDPSVNDPFD